MVVILNQKEQIPLLKREVLAIVDHTSSATPELAKLCSPLGTGEVQKTRWKNEKTRAYQPCALPFVIPFVEVIKQILYLLAYTIKSQDRQYQQSCMASSTAQVLTTARRPGLLTHF